MLAPRALRAGRLDAGRRSVYFAADAILSATPLSALLSGGLVIDLDVTFFVQVGLFFVAFIFLRSLVFKPMLALFEEREASIGGAKAEAKRMEEDAAEKGDDFDTQMRTLRIEAGEEREKMRLEGRRLEAEVLEKVREQTQGNLASAEADLAKEAGKVRSEMNAQIPSIAREIAQSLLTREL